MNIIDKLKAEEVPNNVHQAIEWENGFKCGLDRSIEIVEAHDPWISVGSAELQEYRQYIVLMATGAQEIAQWQGNKFVFRDGSEIGKHRVTHIAFTLLQPKTTKP